MSDLFNKKKKVSIAQDGLINESAHQEFATNTKVSYNEELWNVVSYDAFHKVYFLQRGELIIEAARHDLTREF
jgi:hypothetical protein